MNLVIVESLTKAKEVSHFLGDGWIVKACFGHVRDLPQKETGVRMDDFSPIYEVTEKGQRSLAEIGKHINRVENVYLATDPDREGEAIAWHLFDHFKLNKAYRVTYQEITESAVKTAFKNPRAIDINLVRAQEARRVLDRLIGYTISPKISGMSAGRVQSPTLRLIVERCRNIKGHSKQKTYSASISLSNNLTAEWRAAAFEDENKLILNKSIAEVAAKTESVIVSSRKKSKQTRMPPPPYTTSVFQQAANAKLNLSGKEAMDIAQKLFEMGAITYMRTDSVALSSQSLDDIRRYAGKKGYPLPVKPNHFENKSKNAQEAHEAIRPTSMFRESVDGDKRLNAVYQLIHQRTLLSQLDAMITENDTLVFSAVSPKNSIDGKKIEFQATATKVIKPGFGVLAGTPEENTISSDFSEKTNHPVVNGQIIERETRAAPYFTEATILKSLEKMGIGRPSTYASIMDNIIKKNYVEMKNKQLHSTAKGEYLIDVLHGKENQCTFLDYQYTSDMEEGLDQIARGEKQYIALLSDAWKNIEEDCDKVQRQIKNTKPFVGKNQNVTEKNGKTKGKSSGVNCDLCGNEMIIRNGKNGEFLGCSGFPACKGTKKIQEKKS